MGWLFYNRPKGQSDLDHFREKFDVNGSYLLIDGATKNNVFYGAVADKRTGAVGGFVCLIRRCRGEYNFGYKDMDEASGPHESECPERILNLLSPIEECDYSELGAEWASAWRERCRENLSRRAAQSKVKKGDTVKLATPWTFADGVERDTFTLVDGKRNHWRGADGHVVRLPQRSRWPAYEVLAA